MKHRVQSLRNPGVDHMFRTNTTTSGLDPVDAGEVPNMLAEPSNRRLLALARLAVNRGDSLAWWTLLHLTAGVGPAVRNHFYDRAATAAQTFVTQLLNDRANGYPALGSVARRGEAA